MTGSPSPTLRLCAGIAVLSLSYVVHARASAAAGRAETAANGGDIAHGPRCAGPALLARGREQAEEAERGERKLQSSGSASRGGAPVELSKSEREKERKLKYLGTSTSSTIN